MKERGYREEESETPAYRSEAEVQIARLLDCERIALRYEYPLAVMARERTRIWYPDFYRPEYGMMVEYCGRNDDPGDRERVEDKREFYRETGTDGVFRNKDSFQGDGPARILEQREDVLQKRMDRFYR